MKINQFLFLITAVLSLILACKQTQKKEYEYDKAGYYYKLFYFEDIGHRAKKGQIVKINVSFKTQNDSVFWDSYNNLSDNFYVRLDSLDKSNLLGKCISRFTINDSVCMLMPKIDFYRQQFNTNEIPYFSQKDSIIKINFKIKNILTEQEFSYVKQDLENMEMTRIEAYYGSHSQLIHAKDSAGFYWVEKPDTLHPGVIQTGDQINITYQGYFLNGRVLEKSPQNFDLIYGTPDQLVKGINNVIRLLNVGQNAKIILPSPLAFGEKGSSNGTVPPFTALVYEIKINEIVKNN